jgi:hypothetical protein
MSESEAIKAIRRAAERREYSERLRQQATTDLRENIIRVQREGVTIAQIAREARLPRQGVYDLLAAARPFLTIRSKSPRVGTGIVWPAGVVCFGSSDTGSRERRAARSAKYGQRKGLFDQDRVHNSSSIVAMARFARGRRKLAPTY